MRSGKKVDRSSMKTAAYKVRGHIWVEGEEGAFLGMGRVALLEGIRDTGSITRASKTLKMSYRRAWEHVESMNRQAVIPLVEASTGGKGGGGARITEDGKRAIAAFKDMDEAFRKFREKEGERFLKGK